MVDQVLDSKRSPSTRGWRPSAWIRSFSREPLFHFLVIGAALTLGISAAKGLQKPVVRLDAGELEQLVGYWELQSQREPTRAELQAIIQDRIDEELLAREALRLGLDKGDMIVRRRLAQKMSFASQDLDAVEPDEAALMAYYRDHRQAYAAPAQAALRHIYFSGDRPPAHAQRLALAALESAREGHETGMGDPSLLPLAYADVRMDELAKDYGPQFVEAVKTAPIGVWVGPVSSPLGLHLLKIEARTPPQSKPFAEVRDEVRADVIAERRKASNAQFLAGLRKRYRVEVADLPK